MAAEEIRVIQLKHRSAAEMMPLVQPLLAPGDGLSGTDFRLIVRTSDTHFVEIQRLIQSLDVARRNLTLTVKHGAVLDKTGTAHQLSGDIRVGDRARVSVPPRAAGNGGEVTISQGDAEETSTLRYRTQRITTSRRDGNTQVLRVLDGQRAFIRIGQSVPHVQKILALSDKHATRVGAVRVQEISTGFEVLPRVNGDRVHLEITPRLSTLQDPAVGLVNFQELSTTVTARLGEWIDLGTVLGTHNDIHRTILDSVTVRAGEHRTVLINVE